MLQLTGFGRTSELRRLLSRIPKSPECFSAPEIKLLYTPPPIDGRRSLVGAIDASYHSCWEWWGEHVVYRMHRGIRCDMGQTRWGWSDPRPLATIRIEWMFTTTGGWPVVWKRHPEPVVLASSPLARGLFREPLTAASMGRAVSFIDDITSDFFASRKEVRRVATRRSRRLISETMVSWGQIDIPAEAVRV